MKRDFLRKYILSIILLSPILATDQDCKLIRETDPYTKETKISTGFIFLSGASVTIDADSKDIIVLFSVEGTDQCFDDNSTADVFFEGIKSKTMSRNGGTMNCEGLFQFVFKNSNSMPTTLLQRLCTKKVTQLVFTANNKKVTTINVAAGEQETLMTLVNCLVKEAKTLIK